MGVWDVHHQALGVPYREGGGCRLGRGVQTAALHLPSSAGDPCYSSVGQACPCQLWDPDEVGAAFPPLEVGLGVRLIPAGDLLLQSGGDGHPA